MTFLSHMLYEPGTQVVVDWTRFGLARLSARFQVIALGMMSGIIILAKSFMSII